MCISGLPYRNTIPFRAFAIMDIHSPHSLVLCSSSADLHPLLVTHYSIHLSFSWVSLRFSSCYTSHPISQILHFLFPFSFPLSCQWFSFLALLYLQPFINFHHSFSYSLLSLLVDKHFAVSKASFVFLFLLLISISHLSSFCR